MSGVLPEATGNGAAQRPAPDPAPESGAGVEPDYRYTLANERTFLAWFRTALALIAGSVAVVQLLPPLAFAGARHALGLLLAIAGGALSVAAMLRWRRVQAAMRRGGDLPATVLPLVLGLGLAALTVLVVVLLVLSWRSG